MLLSAPKVEKVVYGNYLENAVSSFLTIPSLSFSNIAALISRQFVEMNRIRIEVTVHRLCYHFTDAKIFLLEDIK